MGRVGSLKQYASQFVYRIVLLYQLNTATVHCGWHQNRRHFESAVSQDICSNAFQVKWESLLCT